MFIERTRTALGDLMSRRLEDVRLAVMMLNGIEIADRTHVVALGITTEGVKIPLGLWEGSTENATLTRALLADLVDRGLDAQSDQGRLREDACPHTALCASVGESHDFGTIKLIAICTHIPNGALPHAAQRRSFADELIKREPRLALYLAGGGSPPQDKSHVGSLSAASHMSTSTSIARSRAP
jgi:hypothetical protein